VRQHDSHPDCRATASEREVLNARHWPASSGGSNDIESSVGAMVGQVRHRSPDIRGRCVGGRVALAHGRLAASGRPIKAPQAAAPLALSVSVASLPKGRRRMRDNSDKPRRNPGFLPAHPGAVNFWPAGCPPRGQCPNTAEFAANPSFPGRAVCAACDPANHRHGVWRSGQRIQR